MSSLEDCASENTKLLVVQLLHLITVGSPVAVQLQTVTNYDRYLQHSRIQSRGSRFQGEIIPSAVESKSSQWSMLGVELEPPR